MAEQGETEGRDLALREGGEVTAGRMFNALIAAATDPRVDPGKMSALVDLQIRMMDYQKREQFNQDKSAAIMEMPSITKRGAIKNNSGQVQSRYSKFEDIHKVVMPILARHNLVISFKVGHAGNLVTVTPVLSHANGYTEEGEAMALPIDTTGSKNATQGAGSAASYGKRHSLKATLNIIEEGEDNDGQGAGGSPALSTAEQRLVEAAERQAKAGGENYQAWFSSLTAAERGWLVFSGRHEDLKQRAGA